MKPLQYRITEKDGIIAAELPIPTDDGGEIVFRAEESLADVARELGYDPAVFAAGESMVGWNPFKAIGKVVKKIAKSKVLRKVVSVAKDVIKNPITTAALGAVSGGTLLAPMAAANAAVRLTEAAVKAGKKGIAATKTIRKAVKFATKKKRKSKKIRRIAKGMKRRGLANPRMLSKIQMRVARRKVLAKKARTRALKRLGTLAKRGSRRATSARAADFLVNVHLS